MVNITHKEYIDDLIATSVGVEPMAMYYVLQKMNSIKNVNVNDKNDSDHENYIDDLITASVGIDSNAMYYLQQKMNTLINEKSDNLTENDPMIAACINEIIEGIDQNSNNQVKQNNLRQDYVWFECSMDHWLDSQPEIKKALEGLPELNKSNTQDDYVWFAGPLDKSIVSQLDARLADKHMHKSAISNDHQDYVWFEMILDKWIESQPGLKEALDQLAKMKISDQVINEESDKKTINNNKVA